MVTPHLYKILVPDAPLHRRTDRDVYPSHAVELRVRSSKFLLRKEVQPGLQSPTLISSFQGSLDTLLFAFPAYGVTNTRLAAAYQSIIMALPLGTHFIVIHHMSHRATVEAWFNDAGHVEDHVTYVPLPDYVSFTDWAEDAYVAVQDAVDESSYLVEPWEFPRAGDALIADAVQEYAPLKATQAPLIFQGGNCLAGDDFWLLGKDYFADSLSLLENDRPPVTVPHGLPPDAFVEQLFSDYVDATRQLVVIGTDKPIPLRAFHGTRSGNAFFLDVASDGVGTFQPIFHIDMFVTLVGRSTIGEFEVLVGSPKLADHLLGTQSPFSLDEVYDVIADRLAARGMKVYRNPLVHRSTIGRAFTIGQLRQIGSDPGNEAVLDAVTELVAAGATEETTVHVRTWHHITWNNCLVQNSDARGKHVYLPTFGHNDNADVEPIDQAMKALWEKLDFTVHMLGDFNEFARRQGVVHCIKKYVMRGD